MKVTVSTRDLAHALEWVSPAIAIRPNLPVLSCVKITAEDGQLVIAATDFDTQMRTVVPMAVVTEPGTVLVPHRVLAKIVSKFKGEHTELLADPDDGDMGARSLEVRSGRADYRLASVPVNDYPPLRFDVPLTGDLDADLLRHAVGLVSHAASNDAVVPVLCGIHLRTDNRKLVFTATDRYRIASTRLGYDGDAMELVAEARELVGVLKAMHGTVQLGVAGDGTNGLLMLTDDTSTATLRVVSADFPKVHHFLKVDHAWSTKVNRLELADALDRVDVLRDHDKDAVRVAAYPDRLQITNQASLHNEHAGAEVVDCKSVARDDAATWPLVFGVNPTYLRQALLAHTCDQIELGSTDLGGNKPFTIAGDASLATVLMPMRLQN